MEISVEALWKMPEAELLSAYHRARRRYGERRFARETERARLQWLRAKAFAATSGSVAERQNAVDASEEFGRKGQHVREMTLELDLLKSDIDVIAMSMRLRGMAAPPAPKLDELGHGETQPDGG